MAHAVWANVWTFVDDESGVSAVEWGLMAGLVGIMVSLAAGSAADAMVLMMEGVGADLQSTQAS